MRVIRELNDQVTFNNPIVTLGTFDGVHLGHQEIVRQMVEEGKSSGRETVLLTFHPHPRMVLYPESHSVRLIDSIEEKLEKLEKTGLDTVILFPFTQKFSRLTAAEFVRDVLVRDIGVSQMLVGYDHHFGKNREGDFHQLQDLGQLYGFEVKQVQAIQSDDVSVSSTKIRKALSEGAMSTVERYLGRPFQLTGEVIHGNKLGRTIGFPTANLYLDQTTKILPETGVYAVKIHRNGVELNGVMNIGKKPTVQQSDTISVEVYIFDFDAELYGETLRILVFDRLRGEHRFASVDELKSQLAKDEQNARNVLAAMV